MKNLTLSAKKKDLEGRLTSSFTKGRRLIC